MRAKIKIWQPLVRRYGKRGALLLLGLPLALIIGGSATYASLLLGGGNGGAVNLQSGLVGWWKMDGNAKDSTPYGANGILSAPPTLVADRHGASNKAYFFDGSNTNNNQTILVNNLGTTNSQLNILGDVSVSAWVKPLNTYFDTAEAVLRVGQGTDLVYSMYYDPINQRPFFQWYDGTFHSVFGNSGTISLGQWSHVVITRSGTTVTFYVNGQSAGSSTVTAPTVGASQLSIGRTNNVGVPQDYTGYVDDMRIYKRVLSATEITALYKEYNPLLNAASGENGLIGWWKLNGNYKDYTPNAHNGALNGSPTPTTDRKGQANGAYSFNGSTDFFQMPGGSIFNTAVGQAKTYSIWFKGNTPAATSYFYWEQGGCLGWAFSMQTNGQIQFLLTTGDNTCTGYIGYSAQPTTSYGDNKWHLATAVVDRPGGNEYLYIDGALQKTVAIDNIHGSTGGTLRIGTNWNNSLPFAGSLADARIYNRALSAPEISNLYNSYNSQISLYGGGGSSVNLAQGLVGEWDFTGNAKDSTPYSNNGNVNGATLTTDRHGSANSAYSFDGISSRINFTNLVAIGQPGLTVSAWINPSTLGSATYAVVNHNGPYLLWVDGTNKRVYTGLYQSPTWYWAYGATNALTTGTWQHIAMTYDGTSRKIYLNGSQTGTTDTQISGNITSITGGWAIGYDNCCGGRFYFPGSIDNVRIYNRALSATEVQALYNLY